MTALADPRFAVQILPRIALFLMPVAWLVLAVTMPVTAERDLTVDVVCASGNPVVAVWIESTSGGSRYARVGASGPTPVPRFISQQQFVDSYQVRVGCGGTAGQWGLVAVSDYRVPAYRRLVCDDVEVIDPAHVQCRDLISG